MTDEENEDRENFRDTLLSEDPGNETEEKLYQDFRKGGVAFCRKMFHKIVSDSIAGKSAMTGFASCVTLMFRFGRRYERDREVINP